MAKRPSSVNMLTGKVTYHETTEEVLRGLDAPIVIDAPADVVLAVAKAGDTDTPERREAAEKAFDAMFESMKHLFPKTSK